MTPTAQTRLVQVRTKILKQNDVVARELRERFRQAGVCVASLVSSPGSGKTALLEKTLTALREHYRVAALVGDLETDNDAQRLARSALRCGRLPPARCAIWRLPWCRRPSKVGNWRGSTFYSSKTSAIWCVLRRSIWAKHCGSVLFSVTEGEDKPLKYPTIFNTADIAMITKIDLAAAVDCDLTAARRNIRQVRPGMEILEVSAKSGAGMEAWLQRLAERRSS